MDNYSLIELHCRKISQISAETIDEFLIYYAADREKLEGEMDGKLRRYRPTADRIPEDSMGYLKAEYIAFKIFKTGGYISKYLNHSAIKNLPVEQYELLALNAQIPWRLSFSCVLNNPAPNFFVMEDVFSGEVYLLHSPSIQKTPDLENRTWLILLGYNGKCWQTFGLNIGLKNFLADDFFFFATEINPAIENSEMLLKEVEHNPFPFFFLLLYSEVPSVVSRGHEIRMFQSIDDLDSFPAADLAHSFTMKKKDDVLQLKLKRMGGFPHFAVAYFDEREKQLIRTSMTEMGFDKLSEALSQNIKHLTAEATIAVSTGMMVAAKEILGKKIVLNQYEDMFTADSDKSNKEELVKLNRFLDMAISAFNKGGQIDIKELSEIAGIDHAIAQGLWEKTFKDINRQMKNMKR